MLNDHDESNILYVVDEFSGSEKLLASQALGALFKEVCWFSTRSEALYAAARNHPEIVFIDSDVGARPALDSYIVKLLSPRSEIHVYEEGRGSYRNDIIKSPLKRFMYRRIGAGDVFGGSPRTRKVHLFRPDVYRANFPSLSHKAFSISTGLQSWIENNMGLMLKLFCPEFDPNTLGNGETAAVFLTDWSIKDSLLKKVDELAGRRSLFVKLHPHIRCLDSRQCFEKKRVVIAPSALPAEVLILELLGRYDELTVYHCGSSVSSYISSPNLVFHLL